MVSRSDSWIVVAIVGCAVVAWLWEWDVVWIVPLLLCAGALLTLVFQAAVFFSRDRIARQHRLRILETDFGRDAGWSVELDGRVIAVLTEPQFVDMFWESCAIEWLDEPEGGRVRTDIQWWEERL